MAENGLATSDSSVRKAVSQVLAELTEALEKHLDREVRYAGKMPNAFDQLAYIKFWAQMRMTEMREEAHAFAVEQVQAARETGMHDDTR